MNIAGHVSPAMLADRVRVLWPPGPKCRPIRDANERCRASITGALERGPGNSRRMTPSMVLDLSPYPCDCNALQFRRTIVLRLGAQRSSPFAQSSAGLHTAPFGGQSRATSRGG